MSDVDFPNCAELPNTFPWGVAKFGWLKRLKKFAWNCSDAVSRRRNFLPTPKSVFTKPGPIRVFRRVGLSQKRPKFKVVGQTTGANDAGFRNPSAGFFPKYGLPAIRGLSVKLLSRFASCAPSRSGIGTPL